jgi:uncharacterized protein YrrD
MDLGPPISYLVLERGTPVFCSDGEEVGTVVHVLAAEREDLFEGIVIHEDHHRRHRFVDEEQVEEIHERGVVLKLDLAAARELPEPSQNPAVMRDDPAAGPESSMGQKLRRAWDRLSGRG